MTSKHTGLIYSETSYNSTWDILMTWAVHFTNEENKTEKCKMTGSRIQNLSPNLLTPAYSSFLRSKHLFRTSLFSGDLCNKIQQETLNIAIRHQVSKAFCFFFSSSTPVNLAPYILQWSLKTHYLFFGKKIKIIQE